MEDKAEKNLTETMKDEYDKADNYNMLKQELEE